MKENPPRKKKWQEAHGGNKPELRAARQAAGVTSCPRTSQLNERLTEAPRPPAAPRSPAVTAPRFPPAPSGPRPAVGPHAGRPRGRARSGGAEPPCRPAPPRTAAPAARQRTAPLPAPRPTAAQPYLNLPARGSPGGGGGRRRGDCRAGALRPRRGRAGQGRDGAGMRQGKRGAAPQRGLCGRPRLRARRPRGARGHAAGPPPLKTGPADVNRGSRASIGFPRVGANRVTERRGRRPLSRSSHRAARCPSRRRLPPAHLLRCG